MKLIEISTHKPELTGIDSFLLIIIQISKDTCHPKHLCFIGNQSETLNAILVWIMLFF